MDMASPFCSRVSYVIKTKELSLFFSYTIGQPSFIMSRQRTLKGHLENNSQQNRRRQADRYGFLNPKNSMG